MRSRLLILIAGLVVYLPNVARAETIYEFSGNITPYFGLPSGAAQSFRFIAPGFITQDTFAPASLLSQCSTGYTATCIGIHFLPSSPGWGIPRQVVQIWFEDGVVNPNYYFTLTAFTVAGTYNTVFYQGANTGKLTVIVTPEPATFSLLAGPLAILLARSKHRVCAKRRLRSAQPV
jgi:hypothetical protein